MRFVILFSLASTLSFSAYAGWRDFFHRRRPTPATPPVSSGCEQTLNPLGHRLQNPQAEILDFIHIHGLGQLISPADAMTLASFSDTHKLSLTLSKSYPHGTGMGQVALDFIRWKVVFFSHGLKFEEGDVLEHPRLYVTVHTEVSTDQERNNLLLALSATADLTLNLIHVHNR